MTLDIVILGAIRGLHLAALSLSAGVLLLGCLGNRVPPPGLRWLLVTALASGLAWLGLQASAAGGFPAAQWLLLSQTGFGRIMALRIALLVLALIAGRHGLWPLLPAIMLQPLLGHGAAMERPVAIAGATHALAGMLWAGAVVALLWQLSRAPETAVRLARRFSPLGVALVLTLGAGAWGQLLLVGGLPGLLGTGYGRLILAKAALLLVMLACAGLNGLWFAPDGRAAALRWSLRVEALAGGAAVLLAGLLAVQVPGLHETVVWPFAARPVPGLWQDGFLRDRLLRMAVPAALALVALLLAPVLLRWSRWAAGGAVLVVPLLLWQMPVFPAAPFLRPALPTSFQGAEVRRNAVTLPAGAALFARDCAACHGADGKGRGPAATGDPVWPPDLTSAYFLGANDGDWFWRIRHGMAARDGSPSMPPHPGLGDAEIWQIIDWLRGNASRHSLSAEGLWRIPPLAPVWRLRCGGQGIDLSRPPGGLPVYLGPGPAPDGIRGIDPASCTPPAAGLGAALAQLGARPGVLLIDGEGYLRQLWTAPPDLATIARAAALARDTPARATRLHH